jgi:vacuolar-type H+-ATPase subunit H
VNEISNTELKITRIINEIEEDTYKHLNEFKDNTNKELNEFQENTIKLLHEMRKTMQDMKEEFNQDTEILKRNQTEILEMESSISQIKPQLIASSLDWIRLDIRV